MIHKFFFRLLFIYSAVSGIPSLASQSASWPNRLVPTDHASAVVFCQTMIKQLSNPEKGREVLNKFFPHFGLIFNELKSLCETHPNNCLEFRLTQGAILLSLYSHVNYLSYLQTLPDIQNLVTEGAKIWGRDFSLEQDMDELRLACLQTTHLMNNSPEASAIYFSVLKRWIEHTDDENKDNVIALGIQASKDLTLTVHPKVDTIRNKLLQTAKGALNKMDFEALAKNENLDISFIDAQLQALDLPISY